MGFLNSATGVDLGFYAARSYSLMRPPRTARRLIRCREVGSGVVWPGRVQLSAAVGSSSVVVGLVIGQDRTQVALAADQHPVGDLCPGREHEPFRIGVCARTSGRDLDGFDTGGGEDRVERCSELSGAVADQELEVRGTVPEVHQEVADLLGSPGAIWMGGDSEEMHVAGASRSPLVSPGRSPASVSA